MGRPKKSEQLLNSIKATLLDTVETQQQARKLIDDVLGRIKSHLNDENISVPQQLEIMSKLAECVSLLGKTNDTTIKSIKSIEGTGSSDESLEPESELSGEELLIAAANKANK